MTPQQRLAATYALVQKTQTLSAHYEQTRRYLNPRQEIQERGMIWLNRPRQWRRRGELFLPDGRDWRRTGPAEERIADGKELWILRPDGMGQTFERRQQPLDAPLNLGLNLLDGLPRISNSLRDKGETRWEKKRCRLLEQIEQKESMQIFLDASGFPIRSIVRTRIENVETETETCLREVRRNEPLPTSCFQVRLAPDSKPYQPPPLPLSPGDAAPDFRLPLQDGSEFVLSQQRQPVVVDFWATWCRPCLASFPALQKAAQSQQNTIYILIPVWDSPENVDAWCRKNASTFPSLRFARIDKENASIAQRYRISNIPASFRIEAGKIRKEKP